MESRIVLHLEWLMFGYTLCCFALLTFLTNFERKALRFHLALSFADYVGILAPGKSVLKGLVGARLTNIPLLVSLPKSLPLSSLPKASRLSDRPTPAPSSLSTSQPCP